MHAPQFGQAPGRLLVALLAALVAVTGASAHVTIAPQQIGTNTFATFTVRVPTEKDVPTVKLRLEFPATLLVSRFLPKPGWKRDVEKDASGRIAAVSWSGGAIGPDEYEDFTFLARTPKEPGSLSFKAYQTYQGGETVAWVDPENGESPAPVVVLTTAATSTAGGTIEDATAGAPTGRAAVAATATLAMPSVTITAVAEPSAAATPASTASTALESTAVPAARVASGGAGNESGAGSDLPLFTSLTALVLAVLALALAGISLARRRRTA